MPISAKPQHIKSDSLEQLQSLNAARFEFAASLFAGHAADAAADAVLAANVQANDLAG